MGQLAIAISYLLLVIASPAMATDANIGPGCTTAYVIDWDCDGYGLGTALGPDADDGDADVHSADQGITKYGTLAAFLGHLGYTPSTYWYIDPATGDNATCAANDPTKPCQTYAYARGTKVGASGADTIILLRAGTYAESLNNSYPTTCGTSGHPYIVMAYPGEVALVDTNTDAVTSNTAYVHDIVYDGISVTNSASPELGRTFSAGDGTHAADNITIRNCHVYSRMNGVFAMQNLNDWLIEKNLFHNTGTHNIYIGSRDYPNTNIVIRNNVLYRPKATCAQHNGRVTGLDIDGNICHSYGDGGGGISLENGPSGSYVRNNIVFDGEKQNLVIDAYPSAPTFDIYPYDIVDNIIENNTFILGTKSYKDGQNMASGVQHNISFTRNTEVKAETINVWRNTFRNNIIVNYGNLSPIYFNTAWSTYACTISGSCTGENFAANGIDPTDYAKLATFENNIIFSSVTAPVLTATNYNITRGTPPSEPPATVTTNLNWSQFEALSANITGNINADPVLVRNVDTDAETPGLYDCHLQSGSPAIDAASTTDLPATDITGATRGASPEIGAYEYSTGGADTTAPVVSISTGNRTIKANSLSVSWSCSDSVGVTSQKWRIGAAPDTTHGTEATSPATVTGFSKGGNTLYLGCGDAAGNWGGDTITVDYLPIPKALHGKLINGKSFASQ